MAGFGAADYRHLLAVTHLALSRSALKRQLASWGFGRFSFLVAAFHAISRGCFRQGYGDFRYKNGDARPVDSNGRMRLRNRRPSRLAISRGAFVRLSANEAIKNYRHSRAGISRVRRHRAAS